MFRSRFEEQEIGLCVTCAKRRCTFCSDAGAPFRAGSCVQNQFRVVERSTETLPRSVCAQVQSVIDESEKR